VGEDLAIMALRDMLYSVGDVLYAIYGPEEELIKVEIPNRAFGTNKGIGGNLGQLMYDPRERGSSELDRDSPIWRSLWVRTSSREHDLLYSSMNLFSTPIPLGVDYSKEFESLLIQFLATMHKKTSVLYWFLISHRIPVYGWSGLLPKRPDFKAHGVPDFITFISECLQNLELYSFFIKPFCKCSEFR
jgi:hypothetical protein